MSQSAQRKKTPEQGKRIPISKGREQKIKRFLIEAEEAVLAIAEKSGLEVYVESDTRGKFPTFSVRVVMREFLRNRKKQVETLSEQGSSITKRLENEKPQKEKQ